MELFYHPLSRYSQKVLLGLYEKQANFFPRVVELRDPVQRAEFAQIYPPCKLPLLKTSDGLLLPESSIIIEYLDRQVRGGTRLLPDMPSVNLRVRLWDRLIDNDLNNQLFVLEQLLNESQQDELKIRQLRNRLWLTLQELDNQLADNHWLVGDGFTLADCALVPCLDTLFDLLTPFELDNLCRYRQQANIRGAWELVTDEITLAQAEETAGVRNIP
ncbi:glutathione S-transferase family protein [Shewanella sedimentimangrovi]|uniref:Glutathione S-transferase family protein n=1 Tax=Shewanella sedimentimangrovi TaxID=2814293 RepID=A0ABX7R326_9GAMM|nr:glutathione S-transferase family protein [Shewanella sedimentimangrovi]QSX37206.1 glutathione S-transferase family protein [Shewanella sedimentimangrovi]